MGLDDFKTPGRSAYKLKSSTNRTSSSSDVHLLDSIEIDQTLIPRRYDIHDVVLMERAADASADKMVRVYVCETCTMVASTYESMLKVDKLDYRDSDWYGDFMNAALSAARNVDEDDVLDDFTTNYEDDPGSSSESEEDTTPSTGLDSFKT